MPEQYRMLIYEIFDGQGLPDDLALYLHVPTKTDPSMAPEGCESLYVLAPVPNLAHGIDWEQEAPAFRNKIIHFLEHEAGLEGLGRVLSPNNLSLHLILHLNCGVILERLFQ